MSDLSHYDTEGTARMVDVSSKSALAREAVAEADLLAASSTIDRILVGELPKGDALPVARIAGIQAAKRCAELIPLCHPLPLNHAGIDFERVGPGRLRVRGTARTVDRTGVEMEALCAVSIAALTLWDMVKAVDTSLKITEVTLVSKTKQEPRM